MDFSIFYLFAFAVTVFFLFVMVFLSYFSIKTPAEYHSFTQPPIMGSLPSRFETPRGGRFPVQPTDNDISDLSTLDLILRDEAMANLRRDLNQKFSQSLSEDTIGAAPVVEGQVTAAGTAPVVQDSACPIPDPVQGPLLPTPQGTPGATPIGSATDTPTGSPTLSASSSSSTPAPDLTNGSGGSNGMNGLGGNSNFFSVNSSTLNNNSEELVNGGTFFCDNTNFLSLTHCFQQHFSNDPDFISDLDDLNFDPFNPLSLLKFAKLFWFIGFNLYYIFNWLIANCSNFYIDSVLPTLSPLFSIMSDILNLLISSAFPTIYHPLPGRTPISRITLLLFFIHSWLVVTIISHTYLLIKCLLKLISFTLLGFFPTFTIKYLFLYDRRVKNFWITTLSLRDTKEDKKILNSFNIVRTIIIKKTFFLTIKTVIFLTIRCAISFIIHTHPAWYN